jgi:phospholipid/cholesterol/gamma-HCH transport system permease protein
MDVSTRHDGSRLLLRIGGDWNVEVAAPTADDVLGESLDPHAGDGAGAAVDRIVVEPRDLGTWDSSLLVFLTELSDAADARGLDLDTDALPSDLQRLVAMAQAVPERDVDRDEPPESLVDRLGEKALQLWDGLLDFIAFTGQVIVSAGRVVGGRGHMRTRDFWLILQNSSARALPIVTLIAFLVGLILSFLGAVVLRRFGADYYVSYLVSYGMLRELGALMTAIIMAGRTGAAFAAELGSMKISEEIDALKTLGLSPIDVLVLPRVVAVVVALPMLTLYADAVGILGGWTVAINMLDVTTPQFFVGLVTPVTLSDALLGVVKAVVYGVIIGVTGCLRGLNAGSDASAVGNAATSAVVVGITLIVLANAIIDWMAAVLNV